MTEMYFPSDIPQNGIYDYRYWNIFYHNAAKLIPPFVFWAYRMAPPMPQFLNIKFCGNPICSAPFGYYDENKPSLCNFCRTGIDWGNRI